MAGTPAVKGNGVPLVNADGTPALCKDGGCCAGIATCEDIDFYNYDHVAVTIPSFINCDVPTGCDDLNGNFILGRTVSSRCVAYAPHGRWVYLFPQPVLVSCDNWFHGTVYGYQFTVDCFFDVGSQRLIWRTSLLYCATSEFGFDFNVSLYRRDVPLPTARENILHGEMDVFVAGFTQCEATGNEVYTIS